MSVFPDGTPCWADAMLPDLAAAKRFYGEVLGWTFEEGAPEFGGYTQAMSGGARVAAIMPTPPDMASSPPAWSVYFAAASADDTARRIADAGGQVVMPAMDVGDFGRMLIAQDPAGIYFGVWQARDHPGFGKRREPGAYAWTDIRVPETAGVDAFYPKVFPVRVQQLGDPEGDLAVFMVGDEAVAGRFRMNAGAATGTPAHLVVYFAVEDCEAAVATVLELGGELKSGPRDSPFGRAAVVADPQGATFAVIDLETRVGELPR